MTRGHHYNHMRNYQKQWANNNSKGVFGWGENKKDEK